MKLKKNGLFVNGVDDVRTDLDWVVQRAQELADDSRLLAQSILTVLKIMEKYGIGGQLEADNLTSVLSQLQRQLRNTPEAQELIGGVNQLSLRSQT